MIKKQEHIIMGVQGEDFVCKALKAKGYNIIGRNIRYKCGELDIVAEKYSIVHFIEVKTTHVNRETVGVYVPEDNMTFRKIKKTLKAIGVFLMDYPAQDSIEWQFDVAAVYIRGENSYKINFYPNIIL